MDTALKQFTGQGKVLEDYYENVHNIGLDHGSLKMTPKTKATKAKGEAECLRAKSTSAQQRKEESTK